MVVRHKRDLIKELNMVYTRYIWVATDQNGNIKLWDKFDNLVDSLGDLARYKKENSPGVWHFGKGKNFIVASKVPVQDSSGL